MRRIDYQQDDMFSYLSRNSGCETDHPLRELRAMTDELERMSPLFDAKYAEGGRPSIPPEKVAVGPAFADAVFGSVGAAADGGDRLQHFCTAGLWGLIWMSGCGMRPR
jgi:hypothetical protein